MEKRQDERGAYLVIMSIGIVMVLLLAGLIIDSAKLYRAHLRMQKAADAGVIAGLVRRVELGPTATAGVITPRMDAVIDRNLLDSGVQFKANYIKDSRFTPADVIATATISGNVDLFIMDILPLWFLGIGERGQYGYQAGVPLQVLARGEVAVANVALALDISGSMRCPVTSTTCGDEELCAYITAARQEHGGACPLVVDDPIADGEIIAASKITALRHAASQFVDQFTPDRDRIGIVAFNTGARRMRDVKTFGNDRIGIQPCDGSIENTPCDWQELRDIINELNPIGNTNPSAALVSSIEAMPAGVLGNEQSAYLLFTDGSPTAGRFRFADPYDDPQEFMLYKVEWSYPDGITIKRPSYLATRYPEIGDNILNHINPDLADTADVLFNHTDYLPRVEYAGEIVNFNARKNVTKDDGTKKLASVPMSPDDPLTPDTAFEDYIENLNYFLPDLAKVSYGGNDTPFANWKEQYYRVTMSLADYLRQNRGNVFTIGLGAAAQGVDYPYQNIDDDMHRKDIFLSRVALDFDVPRDPLPEALQDITNLNLRSEFPGFTWPEYSEDINQIAGDYYPIDTNATPAEINLQLQEAFRRVAKRILLKLIN